MTFKSVMKIHHFSPRVRRACSLAVVLGLLGVAGCGSKDAASTGPVDANDPQKAAAAAAQQGAAAAAAAQQARQADAVRRAAPKQ